MHLNINLFPALSEIKWYSDSTKNCLSVLVNLIAPTFYFFNPAFFMK